MPLKTFFIEQIHQLCDFLRDPEQTVRCVRVDPEMKPQLMKALAGLDRDPDSPHLMLCAEVPYEGRRQFFEALLRDLADEVARWEKQLAFAGAEFKLKPQHLSALQADERYVTYVSALADSLPDDVGSVVVILAPADVADAQGYRQAVEFLATRTPSRWVKFIALDERRAPALENIEGRAPVGVQTFHLAPEQIERQARADLESGLGLNAKERRQYTALLASFAFARREYDQTLALQTRWLEMIADEEPSPQTAEAATAYYNLGNTHLACKDFAAAEETFGQALGIALDKNLEPLVPMVLTNLGVALHRQGRTDEALQSFQIARETCKARGMLPTEAHVLDCLAKTYEADGKHDEAERCWNEALEVYDGMTAETFAAGRESGKADIVEKLERLAASKQVHEQPVARGWFGWLKGA